MADAPASPELEKRLNALLAEGPAGILKLVLWKNRHRQPEMYVRIDERDLHGFDACCAYLKLEAEARIERPGGRPAIPAIPAAGKRAAIPARPEIPPKPWIQVTLVEKGTANMLRPVEDNQTDYDEQTRIAALHHARDRIGFLTGIIRNGAAQSTYSNSEILELCEHAERLAQALRS
ncbi:MAG TPA: hypothetical protein VF151_10770 [Gemmatimonadales bacterium]